MCVIFPRGVDLWLTLTPTNVLVDFTRAVHFRLPIDFAPQRLLQRSLARYGMAPGGAAPA